LYFAAYYPSGRHRPISHRKGISGALRRYAPTRKTTITEKGIDETRKAINESDTPTLAQLIKI
jgi:protein tyrosine phosphatase (PTP) superfamily phosphohydrolase (DUF442 family)